MAKKSGAKVPERAMRYVRRISVEYQLRVSLDLADATREDLDQCQRWVDKARIYAKELGMTLRKIDPLLDMVYQKN